MSEGINIQNDKQMQKDFFIEKRWISKNAWGPFVVGIFAVILICSLLYFSLLRGNLKGNEPYYSLLIVGVFIVVFFIEALGKLRISALRQSYFQLSILEDSLLVKQIILSVDLNKSFLTMRNPGFGIFVSSFALFLYGAKIEKEDVSKMLFNNMGYVSVKRGPIDKIFGLYKVIISRKSTNYSKFHPPATFDYTGDVVGNSSPADTFNNLQYRKAGIIVIPGLNKENAYEILQLLQSKNTNMEPQREVPPTLRFWNIIKGVVYGIILVFIYGFIASLF